MYRHNGAQRQPNSCWHSLVAKVAMDNCVQWWTARSISHASLSLHPDPAHEFEQEACEEMAAQQCATNATIRPAKGTCFAAKHNQLIGPAIGWCVLRVGKQEPGQRAEATHRKHGPHTGLNIKQPAVPQRPQCFGKRAWREQGGRRRTTGRAESCQRGRSRQASAQAPAPTHQTCRQTRAACCETQLLHGNLAAAVVLRWLVSAVSSADPPERTPKGRQRSRKPVDK